MAQAPATPKPRRALRRLLAALGGPAAARRAGPLAPSEEAALRLRAARAGHPAPTPREVTFLVPLVSPRDVGDWQAVTGRLAATLESFRAQDDSRWRAVICCQEAPPLPADDRIRHLPFDDPTPGNDKWRKLAALCADHGARAETPGYVMSFDADDLLRQGTVAEMLGRAAPGGYLAETGFVRDAGTGAIALAGPPRPGMPLRKPFWKLCGSCAALAHDPGLPESAAFLAAMTQHEHRMFPYLAALAGQRLTPLERPSVLYELNHGENFGARRGRVGFKARFVERFRIDAPETLAAIARDFP
ncbi:hypothetical protein [Roseivivax sp. CAU 1761]